MSQKLKGIYDALDHGNYKNAVKECAAFLKKNPGHALCKALHAVALERSGRRDEALQLCGEVRATPGIDDTVVGTVQLVYRRCRQMAEVTKVYEEAFAREPENEEYAVRLFACLCFERAFAKAQQVATRLYGKLKKPKHLHWIVASILLQASGSEDASKVLGLAGMMLQKAPIKSEVLKTGGDVPFDRDQLYLLHLHLETLRLQGKPGDALQLLEDCKALVRLPQDLLEMRARLHEEAGEFVEAARLFAELVQRAPSNFASLQEYIRLAFLCPAPDDTPPSRAVELGGQSVEVPDHGARLRQGFGSGATEIKSDEDLERLRTKDEVWNALLLFRRLQAQAAGGGDAQAKGRAGTVSTLALAELELWRAAFCACEAAAGTAAGSSAAAATGWKEVVSGSDLETFVGLVTSYVERFGHVGSCFFNLKSYLCLLDSADVAVVLERAAAAAAGAGGDRQAAEAGGRLRRAFRRSSGGAEESAEDVRSALEAWQAAEGASPDLLLLAVVALADADREACRTGATSHSHLVDAIALAVMGLNASQHVFHFRVLLTLMYGALGQPSTMMTCYNALEVKNIQHETLSHLAFDVLCAAGGSEGLRDVGQRIMLYHEDLEKDKLDAVASCLNMGVLHRIPEYLHQLGQVSHSVLRGWAAIEEVALDVGQAKAWDELVECAGRHLDLTSGVSSRPAESWVVSNQDRCLLNGLVPLPCCSPLAASGFSPHAWRSGGLVPTVLVQNSSSRATGSSALIWGVDINAALYFKQADRPTSGSAVDELLGRGLRRSPARLRLSASLLRAACVLLHHGPSGEHFSSALEAARGAFREVSAPGTDLGDGAALVESASSLLAAGDASADACWSPAADQFADLCRACAFHSCEAAGTVLECLVGDAADRWEKAEQQLAALATIVKGFVECVRKGAEGVSIPLAIGRHGAQWLWTLQSCCFTVLVPISLWCAASLPKAGGKKAKEGQEALHAARVALRNLLSAVQGGLTDLHGDLGSACDGDDTSLLPLPEEGAASPSTLLKDPSEFQKFRAKARETLLDSHRKHLRDLRECTHARLALVKSKGSFKP